MHLEGEVGWFVGGDLVEAAEASDDDGMHDVWDCVVPTVVGFVAVEEAAEGFKGGGVDGLGS